MHVDSETISPGTQITDLEISLLGELRVLRNGADVPLPRSRKTRALLAFLIETGRPHRRERLCELFWVIPDDPKAALRWSLSKLRKVVDLPEQTRIVADRERVSFNSNGLYIDIHDAQLRLREGGRDLSVEELEELAHRLDTVPLEGLDDVGADAFRSWLAAVREDVHTARVQVLRLLATNTSISAVALTKWKRLWREADPDDFKAFENATRGSVARASETLQGNTSSKESDSDLPVVSKVPASTASQSSTRSLAGPLRAQKTGFCDASDGTRIAFATLGSGPPLLKAANWLTHLEFDWTSPIWGDCFSELTQYRNLIRYDERGCGLSDWDVQDLTFEAFVQDLEAVVDELGLERFPLLGISQGAAVSIEYAVRHPERVSGLILLGSYAAGWRHHTSPEEQARREAVMQLTEVGWGTNNPAYRHIFSQTFMPDATMETLAWFDEFQRLTTSPGNAARFQSAFGDIDVRGRLAQVKTPTIVLHSRHDQRIPLEEGRAVASNIPGAQFVTLESRNHILVDYEPAWRTFMDAMQNFLDVHCI